MHADWIDDCPRGVWFAPASLPHKRSAIAVESEGEDRDAEEEDPKKRDLHPEETHERKAAAAIIAAENLQSAKNMQKFCAHDMVSFTPFTSPCSRGVHYTLVNSKQWRLLAGWYGCDVTIARLMIKEGHASKPKLETVGFTLTVSAKSLRIVG